jgi:2-polyprenyl-3-methyl-5-hydroxy-6-metoxy-1,4-benzoquinol methylase
MFISTVYRTNEVELMDDFSMNGAVLKENLDEIAKVNQILGGNKLTLQGVNKLLQLVPATRELTIVDIGCGNGDMLREIANYGLKNNLNLKLIGVDANSFTIDYAQKLSAKYDNISYQCKDIFEPSFREQKSDIVLCTLVLHHFKEEDIIHLLKMFYQNVRIGIVINDLQRSSLAYRLFQVFCIAFRFNEISRKDGLTSILRGFKKEELIAISEKINFKKYTLKWKFAFRYQWIISKI